MIEAGKAVSQKSLLEMYGQYGKKNGGEKTVETKSKTNDDIDNVKSVKDNSAILPVTQNVADTSLSNPQEALTSKHNDCSEYSL